MSIVYSNTTTKAGILQKIERELGFNDAFITGDTTRLKEWTADVNQSLDDALAIILPASGTWKFDDSNHTDYPIISTNLVSSQRDYSFTVDANSNLILDIYKVFVADSSGVFTEISPVDVETGMDINKVPASGQLAGVGLSSFTDGQNATGIPYRYDKQANAIFLYPIPNYNYTDGLKIYVNREGYYFTTGDTTRKPGFAGLFHEYCVINPAYKYAASKNMPRAKQLLERKLTLERAISDYYGRRPRDERRRLVANIESCE